ncbi:aminotransferase class I/II-fold pyridoxal phosphate-dependent enzyme [Streptomyces sp. NPDC053474]|uniref:aminotransferase class I/II-fold pyridoxal phosphate-dependent enzyme n=1 Tax=Streptomyces sp. NPDC053474 TaxID=3365704 RepID=UPI0037D32CD9
MLKTLSASLRERRQGGDLTSFPDGVIRLDLSICSNTLGPPPSAVRAVHNLVTARPESLVPPPYAAERTYAQHYAAYLGVKPKHLICGRGVTEFLFRLSKLLYFEKVALVVPEYTETMNRFHYAAFYAPQPGQQDTAEDRLERIRQAMQRHQFVVISNPSNPLGLSATRQQLVAVAGQNPGSTLIVDEEYVHLGPPGVSVVGAPGNIVVLQSTGKTFGLTGTRAGVLWTRNSQLREAVAREIPSWPLSLLDVAATTAALRDTEWIENTVLRVRRNAQRLERLLAAYFGAAVVPSQIHYRFVYLDSPEPVAAHLEEHGIAVRSFDGDIRGRASGIRVMTPQTDEDFVLLEQALHSLP